MAKIINTKTDEVIYSDENSNCYGIVSNFLENNTKTGAYTTTIVYECLSDLVETMTGDSITPFNNVSEMIKHIPDILTASEESTIIQLPESNQFFVLPYDYEDYTSEWNKILQTVFPEYSVVSE